jgi:3-deoxy-D-manno-octulosonic-acid transferase
MLWLYRLIFVPALIVMAPRYLWRMTKRGGYAEKFGERFGSHGKLPRKRPEKRRIWLQAVSVGEVLAIAPLLESLVRAGDTEIYLTTTTSTGFRVALDRYRHLVIGLGYFPIDWWWFSHRAWRAIDPDLVVLTEGERWPEHIHQANTRGVPVVCINARMSDKTYRRLRNWPVVREAVLGGITRLLPSSTHDEQRFRELGVQPQRITTTGNLKLDVQIPRLSVDAAAALREELGLEPGLLVLGSSTWPGEEEALVEAWQTLRREGLKCSLLLVPRHAERRPEVEQVAREAGVAFHLRSQGKAKQTLPLAIGDTTGELRNFTQLADVVFIGKSLPPNEGGQTPVEAAALEKPILFGPNMSNFRPIARELLEGGGAIQVMDTATLAKELKVLLSDASLRRKMAAAAAEWQRANAGAVERTLTVIREELARR